MHHCASQCRKRSIGASAPRVLALGRIAPERLSFTWNQVIDKNPLKNLEAGAYS
jgi:hypothetical protein